MKTKLARRTPKAANLMPKITPSPPGEGATARIPGPAKDITERQQAQETLRKSEERYRLLFNSMTEGFALHELIFDENGEPCDYRFLDVNRAFEQLTGLKREDLIGKGQREVLPEEDPFWFKTYCKVALNGESVHLEHYSPPLQRHFDVYAFCPKPNQFAVVFTDVTGRVQIKDALAASEAELRALFASMHDVVMVIDREGVYRKIAPTNPGLLVKPPEELLGKNLKDVFPAEQAEAFRGVMQQVLDTKQNAQIEYELIIGGQSVWFQTTISPLNADSTLWVAHDITNRKQVEEALAKEQYQMQTLMNHLPTSIYFKDRASRFIRISKSLALSFDLSDPAQAIGKTDFDFFTEEHARQAYEDEQAIIQTGQTLIKEEKETRANRPDVWVSTTKLPLRDNKGNVIGTFGISTDITERVQAERLTEALYEISKAVYSTANVDELFQRIHHLLSKIMPVNNFFIALLPNDGKTLHFPYYMDEKDLGDAPDIDADNSQSLTVEVLKTKRPLLLNEAELQDRYATGRNKVWGTSPKCWLGIPLMLGDHAIGVMAIQDYHNSNAYSRKDEALLELAATQIAIAIERKQAEEALQTAEANYRSIFENATVGIYQSTPQGRFLSVNPVMARIFGYDSPEEMLTNTTSIEKQYYVDPADRQKFQCLITEQGQVREFISQNRRKDGGTIWALENARAVKDAKGSVLHYEGFITDITERVQAETALLTSEARYRAVVQSANNAIISADGAGNIVGWNAGAEHIFGYTEIQILGQPLTLLLPARYHNGHLAGMERIQTGGEPHVIGKTVEVEGRRKDASEFPLELSLAKWQVAEARFYTAIIRDITERKQAEDELRRAKDRLETANLELQQSLEREKLLSSTDGLTGLCNRRHFFELAAHEFSSAMRYQHPFVILMFDMDDFKQVNDTLGHAAGDKLLVRVAQAAAAQVRASDVVARYGGDEFIVLLPHASAGQALPVAERIRASVAAIRMDALRDDQESFSITLSIGIAEVRRAPVDKNVERVIQRADEAMYTAKQSGRDRIVVFGKAEQ